MFEAGEQFFIPSGDGDARFFSEPLGLRLVEAEWFPGRVARGEAILFLVEGGNYSGQYLALTSKAVMGLREQIVRYGYAGVVVHRITNPTASFDGSEKDAFPIGMAFVWRMEFANMFPDLRLRPSNSNGGNVVR